MPNPRLFGVEFVEELWKGLPQTLEAVWWVVLFHSVAYLALSYVIYKVQFSASLRGETLRIEPNLPNVLPLSAFFMATVALAAWVISSLYLAVNNHYLIYLSVTNQEVPWPLNFIWHL